MAFISSDKLHSKCAPLFLRQDQQYIWGPELKSGLKKINEHYHDYPESQKEKGVMSFAGYPPKDGDFLISEIWDKHLPGWREKEEIDLTGKNIKHDELIEHLNKFTEAPTLSSEEVDFDVFDADSVSIKRMVRQKRGSWFQLPKDFKPNNE